MQFARTWFANVTIAFSLSGGVHPLMPPLTADDIMREVAKRAQTQDSELKSYSVQRLYTLENSHLESDPVMGVAVTYDSNKGKHAKVLHSEHLTAISKRVLLNILSEEEKASTMKPSRAEINLAHYRVDLIDKEVRNGRLCFRLKLNPIQQDKFLLDGEAWVDTQEFAIVHVEGRPSRAISFWIGRPEIRQDFEKFEQFWMPLQTNSVATVRFAGLTKLQIKYFDYSFNK